MDEESIVQLLVERTAALGIDAHDENVMRRIHQAARTAVDELRESGRSEVNLPFLGATAAGPVHLAVSLPLPGSSGAPRLDPREKLS